VAAVCAARGARLLRRPVSGGPGPARNTALEQARTEFVAFLDSDCVPSPGWIAALAGHFADPLVAAVAPRVVAAGPARLGAASAGRAAGAGEAPESAAPGSGAAGGGGGRVGGLLDLGDRAARVAPLTRVSFVPTAALLVRRAALGDGFDPALRHGEDVDLVWRLIEAGWRVRYEPSVQVGHADPAGSAALLARRFRYGSSAAPLARRHPGALTPLILQPWPALTMTALLARRPALAAAAFGASTALLARRLRDNGLPAQGLARPMANGVWQTFLGTGRWSGQFAAPAVVAVLARPGGRTARVRWGRRLAAASLLAGPPLAQWARDRRAAPHPPRPAARQRPGPKPDCPAPGCSAPGCSAPGCPDPGRPAPGRPAPGRPCPAPGRSDPGCPDPGRLPDPGPGPVAQEHGWTSAVPGGTWLAQPCSSALGAVRQIAGTVAEQAAYGAGVYAGCLRERTLAPVLPTVTRKPFEGLRSRRDP
jgi:GT2 family glycosyltransferase